MPISPRAFSQTISLALKSVLLHKLRSALTVLGILIGVTAVIWLVAMGEGVSYQAQQQIKNLGATNIIIRSIKPTEQAQSSSGGPRFIVDYGILRNDFERIQKSIPAVVAITPVREIVRSVRYENRTMDARVVGCTPAYLEMNQLSISRGRFIEDEDQSKQDNICVIGHETAKTLFPYENPIGRSIMIDSDFYLIVGETDFRVESAGIGGSLSAQQFNNDIYIPLETLRYRIGDLIQYRPTAFEGENVQLSQVTVKVRTNEDVDSSAAMIEEIMKRSHPIKDYAITVPKELLRQAQILRTLFTFLLVLIAGISLLVGGIGIMNIMLATVTERTREIGIRRALGAKQGHIMWQFLSETLVLTLAGGALGILMGLLCGPAVSGLRRLIRHFWPSIFETLPQTIRELQPIVAPWSIFVSIGIAVGVGVFFGMYPARRAAKMDPIEALRHE